MLLTIDIYEAHEDYPYGQHLPIVHAFLTSSLKIQNKKWLKLRIWTGLMREQVSRITFQTNEFSNGLQFIWFKLLYKFTKWRQLTFILHHKIWFLIMNVALSHKDWSGVDFLKRIFSKHIIKCLQEKESLRKRVYSSSMILSGAINNFKHCSPWHLPCNWTACAIHTRRPFYGFKTSGKVLTSNNQLNQRKTKKFEPLIRLKIHGRNI